MEANYKLAKWLNNEVSDQEIANLDGFETYQKIKKFSHELATETLDKEKVFKQIESTKKRQKLNLKLFYKFAAAFVLLIGLSLLAVLFGNQEVVSLSKTEQILLPDQSEILLGANSELQYNSITWWFNRNVDLIGKAYFEVEKGSTFNVNTSLGNVQVLGTKFEVNTTSNQLYVHCFEGKVKLTTSKEAQVMHAHEAVYAFKDGGITKEQVQYNQPFWMGKQVKLTKVSLARLTQFLEQQFNIEIDISRVTNKKKFTGSLTTKELKENFQVIASIYKLKIKQISKNKYIFVEHEEN